MWLFSYLVFQAICYRSFVALRGQRGSRHPNDRTFEFSEIRYTGKAVKILTVLTSLLTKLFKVSTTQGDLPSHVACNFPKFRSYNFISVLHFHLQFTSANGQKNQRTFNKQDSLQEWWKEKICHSHLWNSFMRMIFTEFCVLSAFEAIHSF